MRKPTITLFPLFLIVTGLGSIILFFILGFGGLEAVVNYAITKLLVLVPNTHLWYMWKTIPIPVYASFYLFNITNKEEFKQGAKPIMQECGPYVYLIDFDKGNFTFDEETDTVRYKQTRLFFFDQEKSKGKPDDMITMINVIFVAVSHMAYGFTQVDFILETLDDMLSQKGEELTVTVKAKDFLFDGISLKAYLDLLNDPLVQTAGDIELPPEYQDGLFSLFKGRNGTEPGWWEVYRGITDHKKFGQLHSFNGKRQLDIWKGDACNSLNGSDGTLNPPFIDPEVTEVYIYVPEICRSMKWHYVSPSRYEGIACARYSLPPFNSVPEDPDSWCFCPHEDPQQCDTHGIWNIAPCVEGVPLMISKPHFYDTSPDVQAKIIGLNPNQEKHASQLDLYPLLGVTASAKIRLQFNIEIIPYEAMPSFANASRAIIPFGWVELAATLDTLHTNLIWVASFNLEMWPYTRFVFIPGGGFFILLGVFLLYRNKPDDVEEINENADVETISKSEDMNKGLE